MSFENSIRPAGLNLGRRKFLKGMAVLAGITALPEVLAACGDNTATTIPAPTTAVPAATTAAAKPTTAAATTAPIAATTASAAAPAGFDALGPLNNFKAEADPVAFTVKEKMGFVFNKGGQFFVFTNICSHKGCPVPFDPAQMKFVCPCHGSEYDKTGEVLKGPATRRLAEFDYKVVGETLFGKLA